MTIRCLRYPRINLTLFSLSEGGNTACFTEINNSGGCNVRGNEARYATRTKKRNGISCIGRTTLYRQALLRMPCIPVLKLLIGTSTIKDRKSTK